ncbi:MAG: pyruvate dehydrogenase (acetyl-transferring), homodimeric type [Legionellales bacterium]|nr:pyruvate dehydrogenase (acetyl-transferring), homodimeric type [Legionellales bacterium]
MTDVDLENFLADELDELKEWRASIKSVFYHSGAARASSIIESLLEEMSQLGCPLEHSANSLLINSIIDNLPLDEPEAALRLSRLRRWNAIVMVVLGTQVAKELGGHLSTYASMSTLYDIGMDYFFRARTAGQLEDLVYFQGHSVPGIYANSFLSGQITQQQVEHFRQECSGRGLSSYPHPWLMPDYWQFATVSMGLGPLQAIYQARFQRYLIDRALLPPSDRKIWMFCGDGEMDEPESLGAINLASREHLSQLILVVNCNLQRLDGPVRGNGSIIRELEASFQGSGWQVIKVLWSSEWDEIFKRDTQHILKKKLSQMPDGELQNMAHKGVAYLREQLFDSPELAKLIDGYTDEQLARLDVGGHDRRKVYTAYSHAVNSKDKPTVILIRTIKGYGIPSAHAANIAHNLKALSPDELELVAKQFQFDIDTPSMREPTFYKPNSDDPAMVFQKEKRHQLGGAFPKRHSDAPAVPIPPLTYFTDLLHGFGDRELSTTMGFVRFLNLLIRDKSLSDQVVPIVPDESRTFGMEGLFRQIGIYSPHGQTYQPMDREQIMYYRESKSGQLLEEGVNEAGAMASWIAAATAYSTSGIQLLPFYIYYSMFGFQRVGDLIWAAADMRSRGFLLGATAGRTTLAGEGLQHNDGHSHVMAETVPNCISYDPAFIYELVVLLRHGCVEMFEKQQDVFYYITLMNENYKQPAMPKGCESGIIQGMYLYDTVLAKPNKPMINLMGSGTILLEVIESAQWLNDTFGIGSWIWSVTSFTQLKRNAQLIERKNHNQFDQKSSSHYLEIIMANHQAPIVAATDYIRSYPEQIRAYVNQPYYTLGTDGFGLSDTRKRLRQHFEVNKAYIVYTALIALYRLGRISRNHIKQAVTALDIDLSQESAMTFDMKGRDECR